jgi:hypothetical protein
MKGQLRIDTLYAYIVLDADGTEGVPAILAPRGLFGLSMPLLVPLMGADMARIEQVREYVLNDPLLKGKKITLARFTVRENLEVILR